MKCSIIIPTVNRAQSLKGTLQSIIEQKSSSDYEVIVIDNGSTDNTKEICLQFESVIHNFSYYYDAVPGLLTGRHKGAELAKGEILSFLDDDVELSSSWLNGIESAFSRSDVHFATGPCLPKYETYPPEWLKFFWTNSAYGGKHCGWLSLLDLGGKEMYVNSNFVWGLNFSVRKQTFEVLGGFHPDCIPSHLQQFQGDGETGLTMKADEKDYKAFYVPDALLYHLVPKERLTIKYFEKRAFYQGVCDSFTNIRKLHFIGYSENEVVTRATGGEKAIVTKVKSRIKKIFSNKPADTMPAEVKEIHKLLDIRYKEGYDFHQKAFNENDDVKKWVLKENYMEYKLPQYDRKD